MTSPASSLLTVSGIGDQVYVDSSTRQVVRMNANGFFRVLLLVPPPRSIDLLRIAVGAYAIDRILKRRMTDAADGIRQFDVTFEVRDLSFWKQSGVRDLVEEILSFLTGDDWCISFSALRSDVGHQDFLDLPRLRPNHVMLYSGGLDSAAGLANEILKGADRILLVTVGHHLGLRARIAKDLGALRRLLRKRDQSEIKLFHSTLSTFFMGGKAARIRLQERTQRSRGFLFCSAAIVAADAYKLDRVRMLENGVGAINLPLMTGMMGNGMASRGSHPALLRLMSELGSQITERPLVFELPYGEMTKAEMLSVFRSESDIAAWLQSSRSCVHTSMRRLGKTHCGCCPACIERRQAFRCAGIGEGREIYELDVLTDPIADEDKADYLRMYKLEATKWLSGDPSARDRMSNHLRLTGVPLDQDSRIFDLHGRHSAEVADTYGASQ